MATVKTIPALTLCGLLAVATAVPAARAAEPSVDRHAGYYYPAPSSREVYRARPERTPEASRPLRVGFVTAQDTPGQASLYRTSSGFRRSDTAPSPAHVSAAAPTVRIAVEDAAVELPDTAEFRFKRYTPTLSLDFVVQPTIGYVRDNFCLPAW